MLNDFFISGLENILKKAVDEAELAYREYYGFLNLMQGVPENGEQFLLAEGVLSLGTAVAKHEASFVKLQILMDILDEVVHYFPQNINPRERVMEMITRIVESKNAEDRFFAKTSCHYALAEYLKKLEA